MLLPMLFTMPRRDMFLSSHCTLKQTSLSKVLQTTLPAAGQNPKLPASDTLPSIACQPLSSLKKSSQVIILLPPLFHKLSNF